MKGLSRLIHCNNYTIFGLWIEMTMDHKNDYANKIERLSLAWICWSTDSWSYCIHWTLSTWAPSQHWTLGHIGRHLHRQIRPNVLWPFTTAWCLCYSITRVWACLTCPFWQALDLEIFTCNVSRLGYPWALIIVTEG